MHTEIDEIAMHVLKKTKQVKQKRQGASFEKHGMLL